jgi:hypothetical protein
MVTRAGMSEGASGWTSRTIVTIRLPVEMWWCLFESSYCLDVAAFQSGIEYQVLDTLPIQEISRVDIDIAQG